ncbi:hypothetical protein B0H10DRAFT_2268125 [Mycena sp. CBHHK59/15]|nr:hypothetical protein B0H10DRAFT_2268125 [Mycena sp. CBHHK59/15]
MERKPRRNTAMGRAKTAFCLNPENGYFSSQVEDSVAFGTYLPTSVGGETYQELCGSPLAIKAEVEDVENVWMSDVTLGNAKNWGQFLANQRRPLMNHDNGVTRSTKKVKIEADTKPSLLLADSDRKHTTYAGPSESASRVAVLETQVATLQTANTELRAALAREIQEVRNLISERFGHVLERLNDAELGVDELKAQINTVDTSDISSERLGLSYPQYDELDDETLGISQLPDTGEALAEW